MARYGGYRSRGVVCGVSEKVQTELGFLAIPAEQWIVDCLGNVRPCLRAHFSAAWSRLP